MEKRNGAARNMSPSQTAQAHLPYGRGELLLLVEDDLNVLEILKTILVRLGYQVLTAANGRAALEIYDQHQDKIALVLTDVRTPELDGLTLAQILHEHNPAIKVILLTGYSLDLDPEAVDLLPQGIVVGWLEKPVGIEPLAQIVNRALW
jgi:two-component system cell cycle sensor histidine kinase/response regulator CckA